MSRQRSKKSRFNEAGRRLSAAIDALVALGEDVTTDAAKQAVARVRRDALDALDAIAERRARLVLPEAQAKAVIAAADALTANDPDAIGVAVADLLRFV